MVPEAGRCLMRNETEFEMGSPFGEVYFKVSNVPKKKTTQFQTSLGATFHNFIPSNEPHEDFLIFHAFLTVVWDRSP